jgi:hypothetical protein
MLIGYHRSNIYSTFPVLLVLFSQPKHTHTQVTCLWNNGNDLLVFSLCLVFMILHLSSSRLLFSLSFVDVITSLNSTFAYLLLLLLLLLHGGHHKFLQADAFQSQRN